MIPFACLKFKLVESVELFITSKVYLSFFFVGNLQGLF